jgi:hypothetical protein
VVSFGKEAGLRSAKDLTQEALARIAGALGLLSSTSSSSSSSSGSDGGLRLSNFQASDIYWSHASLADRAPSRAISAPALR